MNDFDKGLNINIGHDGSLRLMVTDFSQLGYHLLQVLSASFAICKALVICHGSCSVLAARRKPARRKPG